MKVTKNVMTVADIFNKLAHNEMLINRDYQRASGLWPNAARSYFIDTILCDYPFPKITLRQLTDLETKETKLEVVDGQQRLGTIRDFLENKIRLSSTSKLYSGMLYEDLDEDLRGAMLRYEVSVDTITQATDDEVLEVFRRMNSYMVKLNDAELRHSSYQGEFKWFIFDLVERYSDFLKRTGILSLKDVSRMKDAELITELCQIIMKGITNHSKAELDKLYKENDAVFPCRDRCLFEFEQTMDFIKDSMLHLFDSQSITSYMFYSLFAALVANRFGCHSDPSLPEPQGCFTRDNTTAVSTILEMLNEVDVRKEQKKNGERVDNGTRYAEFAMACEASTHRVKSRVTRTRYILEALQNS